MTPIRSLQLLPLCLVSFVFLRAGSCLRTDRPYALPKPADLVQVLKARAAALSALRGEARMTHDGGDGKVKATVRMMLQRGKKIRVDLVSPFDTPLATLVANGKDFALVETKTNRYYYGPASPCNLARLLQVQLDPDEILGALGGSTPVIEHRSATLHWDGRSGEEVLTLSGEGYRQTIRIDGSSKNWDLTYSEIRSTAGQVLLRLRAARHRAVGTLRLPSELNLEQPVFGSRMLLDFELQEVNVGLPAVAFELPERRGLALEEVTCPPPSATGGAKAEGR
jgi:outer membrane lipoprotein-sorting protein